MNNKKINIFTRSGKNKVGLITWGNWVYECSTTWSKTCKDAKQRFLKIHPYLNESQVKASFKQ